MYLTDIADTTPPPSVPCRYQPSVGATSPLRQIAVGEGFGVVGGYQDAKRLRQAAAQIKHKTWRCFLIKKVDVGYWCYWRVA